jgi:DNA polymerase III delta prime subunit
MKELWVEKYRPNTVDGYVFVDDAQREQVQQWIRDGSIPHLMLSGSAGTGKTTLAKMLPNAIEVGKTGQSLCLPETFIGCQQGFNGPQVMALIENVLSKVSLNESGLHYFILDEVDNLTKQAQQSLKSALNTDRGLFILTTNNISELDKGLKDRCVLVEMNAAPVNDYLPLAKSLVSDMGVVMSDIDLLPTISGANGSLRNLIHSVERLARRQSLPSPNIVI